MWMILRGVVGLLAAFPLSLTGITTLIWSIYFLILGLRGVTHDGFGPLQLIATSLLWLSFSAMMFSFAAFLGVRGWRQIRREWPDVPRIRFNPAAMKHIMKLSWIPPLAGGFVAFPLYWSLWGWPDRVYLDYPLFFLLIIGIASNPGMVAHEMLHAIGIWFAGRVPCNRIRFGFSLRAAAAYAYTSSDMPVWAYRVVAVLPAIFLGLLPIFGGLALGEPLFLIYGLLMLHVATGDLYLIWRTWTFPARASFNIYEQQDEFLRTLAPPVDA